MPFFPLVDLDGKPTQQGALEQCTCLMALYKAHQPELQAILDATGGGEVVLYQEGDPDGLPCWALALQDGVYWLWIAGTTSATQLLSQASGALWTTTTKYSGVVNSWWFSMSDILQRTIFGLLPSFTDVAPVNVVGDSYGAAVGCHIANLFSFLYTGSLVKLFTFGSPKPFVAGFPSEQPAVHVRLCRANDPVVLLPPSYPTGIWALAAPGLLVVTGGKLRWQHYGTGWLLNDDASISPDGDDTGTGWVAGSRLTGLAVAAHTLSNTATVLAQLRRQPAATGRVLRQPTLALDPQGERVKAILLTLLQGGQVAGMLNVPAPSPGSIQGANAASFGVLAGPLGAGNISGTQMVSMPAPAVRLVGGSRGGGGSRMARRIPPPVDKLYGKVTLFFQGKYATWTESHVYNDQSGSITPFNAPAKALVAARVPMLAAVNATLFGYRLSVIGKRKLFVDFPGPAASTTLVGTINEDNDCITRQWDLRKDNASPIGFYHGRIFYGGIPDSALVAGVYQPSNGTIGNADFDAALGAYESFLSGPTQTSVGNWGVLCLSKEDGVAPQVPILSLATTVGSTVLSVTTKLPNQLAVGDVVNLSRVPGVNANLPLNQNWLVEDVNSPTNFLIALPAPAATALSVKGQGQVWKQIFTWAAYWSQGLIKAGTRIRGNRVFAPRGRRKIKHTVGY